MKKVRLDKLLVERGLAATRSRAQALIASGLVRVAGRPAERAATLVPPDEEVTLLGSGCPYVSRGGLKLAAALDGFAVDVTGLVCADIGASTGGFTDCLLQRGAARVYAIDVGYGQLAWKLRQDERVVVMERTNARYLTPDDLPTPIDLAVIDASFISLRLLLPPLPPLFAGPARIIALIKPQFEAGREQVGKGGIVRDPAVQRTVIDQLAAFAADLGLHDNGVLPSPIQGAKGNQEFLWYLSANSSHSPSSSSPARQAEPSASLPPEPAL